MHVNNFVEIILGKLYNNPHINLLKNITTKSDKVSRGDIFIAKNANEVENAISNGAYAIVSETKLKIIDHEIAWILVDNINLAITRFIKYSQMINNIIIYKCNSITYKIFKNIIKDKDISLCNSLEEIIESLESRIIILDSNVNLNQVAILESRNNLIFKITKKSLFTMQMEYENNVYEIILPYEFISFLNEAICFCKLHNINFVIQNEYLNLMPIFINYHGGAIKYGRSIRFAYASKNNYLIEQYTKIASSASWGKILFLSNSINKEKDKKNIVEYNSIKDIKQKLKLNQYHFFIIHGVEKSELLNELNTHRIESTLF